MFTKLGNGTATTTYPTKEYSFSNATTTAYIFLPDGTSVATIIGNGVATSTHYVHTDHLGGTNVVTDSNADTVQTLDYYPFGDERIQSGQDVSKRKFIGIERDAETGLDYAINRYYANERGQFISQDPVFWEVGITGDGRAVLQNPQLQNSYSYAGNNPITQKDPTGRYAESIFDAVMLGLSIQQFAQEPSWTNAGAVLLDAGGLALPIPAVGGLALRAGKAADTYSVYKGATKGTDDIQYVGITKREPSVRFGEHGRASGTGKESLEYSPMAGGLNKTQARMIEQSYINTYGLQKSGGMLNRMNSINPSSAFGQIVGAFTSAQSGAISTFQGAFRATNAAQEKAIQGVIKAFSGK